MVENLRTYSHQLTEQTFGDAHDVVSYMGVVQAQDIEMSKWAVGIRMSNPSLSHVRDAINSGKIIRTHILRPTWHLVSADDMRWMLSLCGKRIKTAFLNWGSQYKIEEKTYSSFCDAVIKLVSETDGLTIQEITSSLSNSGYKWNADQVKLMLLLGEADGLFCNGIEKNRKHTYALLDERVPTVPVISTEEAISLLALKYFRSHSPASLEDFTWWSGLTTTQAKSGIQSIINELITDRYKGENLYVHETCRKDCSPDEEIHLLPPYDEYLISYKDRSHVLPIKHCHKAHNTFGIFYPVIFHKGKIVGNWKKISKKGNIGIETTFFNKSNTVGKRKLQTAIDRYLDFLKE